MTRAAIVAQGRDAQGRVARCASARSWFLGCVALAVVAAAGSREAGAQGVYLPSIGPTNQSFGGAAVAAPIDSAGALYWNPATLSGLKSSEMAFGLGIVSPHAQLSSTAGGFSGATDSDAGVIPVPTIAWAQKGDDSAWSYGIGIFGVGGFGLNYGADVTNPILSPQPGGLGRIYSSAEIYQVVPTASLALTDRLSIGVAPVVTLAKISLDPLFLAPPDATGVYGPGTGTKYSWGAGFQVGVYYITEFDWHLGASVKSPQWMESNQYHSQTSTGLPVDAKFGFDMPTTVSLGSAYSGFERWMFALDVRYLDWSNANGFSQQGYNPNGSVAGLGWRSTWAVSLGTEYVLTERLTLRSGWQYMQNPIPHGQTMFNVQSALIIENWLSFGAGYKLRRNVTANLAYSRGIEHQQSGPIVLPAGIVPGTSVTNKISADMFSFGVTVAY